MTAIRRARRGAFFLVLAAALIATAPLTASAQTYPSRPVKMICPFPAGGTADLLARLVAQSLSEAWGQPVPVENRTGAAGNIGADLLAKSEPDGYTLMLSPPGPFAINVSLYKQLSYDPTAAFAPISVVAQAASVLVVHPKVPYKSVAELVAYAKANPRQVNYASQGSGTTSHLTAVMLARGAHIELVHVPYRGSAPAVADLLGGHVDIMFDNLGSSMPHIRSGGFRALAVGGQRRSRELPEIPTMIEAGFPGFVSVAWFAVAAPARTPAPIVNGISEIIARAMKRPEMVERLAAVGVEPIASTPAEMGALIREETVRWRTVVQAAGIQPE